MNVKIFFWLTIFKSFRHILKRKKQFDIFDLLSFLINLYMYSVILNFIETFSNFIETFSNFIQYHYNHTSKSNEIRFNLSSCIR